MSTVAVRLAVEVQKEWTPAEARAFAFDLLDRADEAEGRYTDPDQEPIPFPDDEYDDAALEREFIQNYYNRTD